MPRRYDPRRPLKIKLEEEILQGVRSASETLYRSLLSTTNRERGQIHPLAEKLVTNLSHRHKTVRRAAADAIVVLTGHCDPRVVGHIPGLATTLFPVLPALLDAARDANQLTDVRVKALAAIRRMIWIETTDRVLGFLQHFIQLVEEDLADIRAAALRVLQRLALSSAAAEIAAVAKRKMYDGNSGVIVASIEVLLGCGSDMASAAALDVAHLLDHEDQQVRQKACEALQRLGGESRGALPALIRTAIEDSDPNTQLQAALTIVDVDPKGDLVAELVKDEIRRTRLIDVLRRIGVSGRTLRHALEKQAENAHESKQDVRNKFPRSDSVKCSISLIDHKKREVSLRGVPKTIGPAQFAVVEALIEVFPSTLSKDQLVDKSGHTDAVNALSRLRKKGEDWQTAIKMAGVTGGGYSLLAY